MTYREIFKYGKKLETPADKLKFYSVFVFSGLFIGVAYSLLPFFYSHDYLVKQTQKDLKAFVKTDLPLKDTRFSFLKREEIKGCEYATGYSKYTPYAISNVKCKEVQNEK